MLVSSLCFTIAWWYSSIYDYKLNSAVCHQDLKSKLEIASAYPLEDKTTIVYGKQRSDKVGKVSVKLRGDFVAVDELVDDEQSRRRRLERREVLRRNSGAT